MHHTRKAHCGGGSVFYKTISVFLFLLSDLNLYHSYIVFTLIFQDLFFSFKFKIIINTTFIDPTVGKTGLIETK